MRLILQVAYCICVCQMFRTCLFVDLTCEVHQKLLIFSLQSFFLFPITLLQLQWEANPEWVWCATKLSFQEHCCRVLMNIKKKKLQVLSLDHWVSWKSQWLWKKIFIRTLRWYFSHIIKYLPGLTANIILVIFLNFIGIVPAAASKTVLGREDTCEGAYHCHIARKKTTKWRSVYSNSWICLFFLQMGPQLYSFHCWPLQGKEIQHLSESSVLILTYFKELAGINTKTMMWYLAYAIFKSFTLSQLMVDRLNW